VVVAPVADAGRGWNDRSHIVLYHGSQCPRTLCAVMHVPFAEVDVVVGAHTAPSCARGPSASLGRGGSMPTGSGAPILTSQGSGEAEIVPDRPGVPEA
jgi:hypothetical protein